MRPTYRRRVGNCAISLERTRHDANAHLRRSPVERLLGKRLLRTTKLQLPESGVDRGARGGDHGRPRVVVVSHEASRTGAPRVAAQVLSALAGRYKTVLIQRWGGPAGKELETEAAIARREPFSRVRVLLRRFPRTRDVAVLVEQCAALVVLVRHRPAAVWLNTVLSGNYIGAARRLGIPVVLHVHELEPTISTAFARYGVRRRLPDRGIKLVACSNAVREQLRDISGVPLADITVIPSVPDRARILRLVGQDLVVEPAGRTVISCGTADERKGVDVWLRAASLVLSRPGTDDVRFLWVGRKPSEQVLAAAGADLLARVQFCGEQDNPYPAIANSTVFTLLSRKDPFPLVVLEAMLLERPVVVADVGGMPEQVGNDGLVVAAEDPASAAEAILALLEDPKYRQRLGSAAAARVKEHFDDQKFAIAVVDMLCPFLAPRNSKDGP